jgi:VCBS repeat-containing protein
MRSLTFTLDTQTGSDAMAPATVTITETADGSLNFTISNENDADGMIGDIRALFFDVADNGLLGTLAVNGGDVTEFNQSGSVSNLGGGATSSGVPHGAYEVGIEIGTSGAATDDIQTTSFTLSSYWRGLTLDDISLENFTVRQTSVGEEGGARGDSDKLYGDAPYAVNAINDAVALAEDEVSTSNLFANDIDLDAGDADGNGIADGLTVTSVNGEAGSVGQQIVLGDGITATVQADGTLAVDASDADYLSAGESVEYKLGYGVNDGNGGSDTAEVSVTVTGENDDPTARDDFGSTDEATALQGNVLLNDSDIDRLDTFFVSAVEGDDAGVGSTITLDSGAKVTLSADGTYIYDPNHTFDGLKSGQSATDSFTYTISDGNGGYADATVHISIDGIGSAIPEGDHFGVFTNKKGIAQDISNVVFYLREEDGDLLKVKVDGWSGVSDLDSVNYGEFLSERFGSADLLAVSIKAGNNHNADLGPGEGQLFLLDGNNDIDYVQGGALPLDFTPEDLAAKADVTIAFSDAWLG